MALCGDAAGRTRGGAFGDATRAQCVQDHAGEDRPQGRPRHRRRIFECRPLKIEAAKRTDVEGQIRTSNELTSHKLPPFAWRSKTDPERHLPGRWPAVIRQDHALGTWTGSLVRRKPYLLGAPYRVPGLPA